MQPIAWMRYVVAIAMVLAAAGPVFAQVPGVIPPDVILFELTEDMSLTPTHRLATAAIGGFAIPGPINPLCPVGMPTLLSQRPEISRGGVCIINATGSNRISRTTFTGPINGSYTVLVQGDNPVDIEEAVALRGKFSGQMNLSTAGDFPFLGTMTGRVAASGATPFIGVVRLPFPCPADVPFPSPTGFCYGSSGPNGVWDGSLLAAGPESLALGRPGVRLDIYFQAPPSPASSSGLR